MALSILMPPALRFFAGDRVMIQLWRRIRLRTGALSTEYLSCGQEFLLVGYTKSSSSIDWMYHKFDGRRKGISTPAFPCDPSGTQTELESSSGSDE
jgi:hypothetical protein